MVAVEFDWLIGWLVVGEFEFPVASRSVLTVALLIDLLISLLVSVVWALL
ncbi:MAG: hypothetical protein LRY73_09650 [Bacillus sp. (in: Bacteria)]|nr:hypothetical protein [Bacillus sp. (in: firmicutes)]